MIGCGIMADFAVVDLFCGIGGMTHGFVKEGFNVVAGIDIDSTCRYAYEKNNKTKFIHKDIKTVTSEEIAQLYPEGSVKILVGCAPCQPFSTYARPKKDGKKSKARKKDDKWKMLYAFSRIINEVQPHIVSMENVPQLKGPRGNRVFMDFVNVLERNEYNVWYDVVYCPDYGVPQTRKRLVLLASKFGPLEIIEPSHTEDEYPTVRDAIGDLKPIRAGETCLSDPLHTAGGLSPINLKRIQNTPYGGGWKDWKESLRLKCHKKKTGKSYGSVYGRMVWEEPSPTITTQSNGIGNGRFGHPEQDRALSLREAALLQTFPPYYELIDPNRKFSEDTIARHIGNAVPIRLGQVIAKSIKRHINRYGRANATFAKSIRTS